MFREIKSYFLWAYSSNNSLNEFFFSSVEILADKKKLFNFNSLFLHLL